MHMYKERKKKQRLNIYVVNLKPIDNFFGKTSAENNHMNFTCVFIFIKKNLLCTTMQLITSSASFE